MSILIKENTIKKSHKILFTILTVIGMTGLIFGLSVFFVLGSGTKYEAETQKRTPTSLEISQVTYQHKSESQAKSNASSVVTGQKKIVTTTEATLATEPDIASESDEVDYTVKDGDSLSQISEKFKTSVASIVQQTKLSSQEQIYAGQQLNFLRSYVVKEEEANPLPNRGGATDTRHTKSDVVPVDNGNKVVPGGLSKEDRAYVLSQLQSRTGVSASQWDHIISRESGWLPSIKNAIGYYGLFQLAPNYPGYGGNIDAQINGAVYLFNNGGMKHWAL